MFSGNEPREKEERGPVGTNGVVNLINSYRCRHGDYYYYYKEENNWRGINSSSDI